MKWVRGVRIPGGKTGGGSADMTHTSGRHAATTLQNKPAWKRKAMRHGLFRLLVFDIAHILLKCVPVCLSLSCIKMWGYEATNVGSFIWGGVRPAVYLTLFTALDNLQPLRAQLPWPLAVCVGLFSLTIKSNLAKAGRPLVFVGVSQHFLRMLCYGDVTWTVQSPLWIGWCDLSGQVLSMTPVIPALSLLHIYMYIRI